MTADPDPGYFRGSDPDHVFFSLDGWIRVFFHVGRIRIRIPIRYHAFCSKSGLEPHLSARRKNVFFFSWIFNLILADFSWPKFFLILIHNSILFVYRYEMKRKLNILNVTYYH